MVFDHTRGSGVGENQTLFANHSKNIVKSIQIIANFSKETTLKLGGGGSPGCGQGPHFNIFLFEPFPYILNHRFCEFYHSTTFLR